MANNKTLRAALISAVVANPKNASAELVARVNMERFGSKRFKHERH